MPAYRIVVEIKESQNETEGERVVELKKLTII